MVIRKNQYPILEYDSDSKEVLTPNRKQLYSLKERCVFPFLGEKVDQYALENGGKKVAEFDTCTKLFNIYEISYKGHDIIIAPAPLGASASVQFLEFLLSYGVKSVITCGTCGTLIDLPENEILIVDSALRAEGTSYHYLPPSREIELDSIAIEALKEAACSCNIPYELCKTWTTDGYYRETRDMIDYRISEGCKVVEMECAALAACARFRGAAFGQLLYTADTLANLDKHDDRNWGEASLGDRFQNLT